MDARFRIISGGLLAVAIAVLAVQDQLGAMIPQTPIWALVFMLLIIVLREIVKAYGNSLEGIVMDGKYRLLSVILLAVAFALITLESTITSAFPQYATAISIVIILLREMVKGKGLTLGTDATTTKTTDTTTTTDEVETITPDAQVENPEDEV